MLNKSEIFDLIRNLYAQINCSCLIKKGRAILPLRYFFELTHLCNLNCPYCYVGTNRKKEELSTKDWFNVIKQIPFYSFVTLVGGEPLIRKDFSEILFAVCKKTEYKIEKLTGCSKMIFGTSGMLSAAYIVYVLYIQHICRVRRSHLRFGRR